MALTREGSEQDVYDNGYPTHDLVMDIYIGIYTINHDNNKCIRLYIVLFNNELVIIDVFFISIFYISLFFIRLPTGHSSPHLPSRPYCSMVLISKVDPSLVLPPSVISVISYIT